MREAERAPATRYEAVICVQPGGQAPPRPASSPSHPRVPRRGSRRGTEAGILQPQTAELTFKSIPILSLGSTPGRVRAVTAESERARRAHGAQGPRGSRSSLGPAAAGAAGQGATKGVGPAASLLASQGRDAPSLSDCRESEWGVRRQSPRLCGTC